MMRRFIVLLIYLLLSINSVAYGGRLERLRNALNSSVFDAWTFKSKFGSFETLKLDKVSIQAGIIQDGDRNSEALQRLLIKVMKGESITMYVFGGSSTKGADLGCNNRQSTFHYALLTWWNKVIGPATGSYMKRKVIAVGGVGSTFFGHCWEEYIVTANETIDILLWEFYINDPDSEDYGKGVEKFIRSVLSYDTHPALIFIKFFALQTFPNEEGEIFTCAKHEYKSQILSTLSKYYKFSDICLLSAICQYIHSNGIAHTIAPSDMFINKHPSHLAHAQMGYLLISYLRQTLFPMLVKVYSKKHVKQDETDALSLTNFQLPNALYNASDVRSICWNAVFPDDRFMLDHSLYQLTINYRNGFVAFRTPKWETNCAVRRDVRGGYLTEWPQKYISITFQVQGSTPKNVYVAISHVQAGGWTSFTVKDNFANEKTTLINCSRLKHQAMDVNFIGTYDGGTKELIIKTINGGCELSAIIVE